jgi:hypothetical protein
MTNTERFEMFISPTKEIMCICITVALKVESLSGQGVLSLYLCGLASSLSMDQPKLCIRTAAENITTVPGHTKMDITHLSSPHHELNLPLQIGLD